MDKAKDLSEEDSEAHVAKLIRFVVVVRRRRDLSDWMKAKKRFA